MYQEVTPAATPGPGNNYTCSAMEVIIHPHCPELSCMKKKQTISTLILMSIKHFLFSGKHELGPTQYVEVISKSYDVSF